MRSQITSGSQNYKFNKPGKGHDAQCQTSNSTSRKNLEMIRDLEKDFDDAISRVRQEAIHQNDDIFDVDILSQFDPNSNFNL